MTIYNGYFTRRRNVALFSLKWENFQTKIVEIIKTHFMFKNIFQKIVPFMR